MDKERGYEASEEGSVDEKRQLQEFKKFEPLLFACICQPNVFLSKQQLSRSVQFSCFNINVKVSEPEHTALQTIPLEEDFPVNLLETKPGMPHPDTGVLPAFLTCKLVRGLGKPATLDVEIARPTRILCSTNRWDYFLSLVVKVTANFKSSFEDVHSSFTADVSVQSEQKPTAYWEIAKPGEYSKFKEIKKRLYGITGVNFKLAQLVLVFETSAGPQATLSSGRLESHLRITNRPERITNVIKWDCVTLGVSNRFKKLLLNPWSASVEICLFWETWQSNGNDPQVGTVKKQCSKGFLVVNALLFALSKILDIEMTDLGTAGRGSFVNSFFSFSQISQEVRGLEKKCRILN